MTSAIPHTTQEIITELDTINAEVRINRFVESYMKPNFWHADLSLQNEGVKLDVAGLGSTFDDALADAWSKIWPILQTAPGRKLAPPLLTATTLQPRNEATNNEIPF